MKVQFRQVLYRVLMIFGIALAATALIVLGSFLFFPENVLEVNEAYCGPNSTSTGYADTGFARKWDKSCYGWDKQKSKRFMFSALLYFLSFNIISTMILKSHPINKKQVWSIISVTLSVLFVFICGGGHFLDFFTTLYPVYDLQINYNMIGAIIAFSGAIFVTYGLEYTNIERELKAIDDKEQLVIEQNLIEQEKALETERNQNKIAAKMIEYRMAEKQGIPNINISDIPSDMQNFPFRKDTWGAMQFPMPFSNDFSGLVYEFVEEIPFGWHSHFNTEYIIVVEGEVEVSIKKGDNIIIKTLKAGEMIVIDANLPHDAMKKSDKAKFIVLYSPPFEKGWTATT